MAFKFSTFFKGRKSPGEQVGKRPARFPFYRLLFKKQYYVQSLIFQYLEELKRVQESFVQAIETYFSKGLCTDFEFLIEQTHKAESKCDDIRNTIELEMYGKALIPESRGDILGLLETMDSIPNQFELILYFIQTQKLRVPDFMTSDLKELLQISVDSWDLLRQSVESLFINPEVIQTLNQKIDRKESQGDFIERRLITNIFDSDIDTAYKILLRDLVVQIGNISDHTERVSRRVMIINVKRRV
ncbi:MAG: hypothetical protein DRG50_04315 [Deltaproteobacteria bacterium]|nr:MAG: hypothetical protein DRG50_04315 [Deltaproteobacteria bacterium]